MVSQKEIVEGLRNCHTTLMLQANPNDGHATHFRRYVDLLIKRIQAHGIAPPDGFAIVPIITEATPFNCGINGDPPQVDHAWIPSTRELQTKVSTVSIGTHKALRNKLAATFIISKTHEENAEKLNNMVNQLKAENEALRTEVAASAKREESTRTSNNNLHKMLNDANLEIEELQLFCDALPGTAPRRTEGKYNDNKVTMRLLTYFATRTGS